MKGEKISVKPMLLPYSVGRVNEIVECHVARVVVRHRLFIFYLLTLFACHATAFLRYHTEVDKLKLKIN